MRLSAHLSPLQLIRTPAEDVPINNNFKIAGGGIDGGALDPLIIQLGTI